jgi:HlyD family secretion protein
MIKNRLIGWCVVAVVAGCGDRRADLPGYQGVIELEERTLGFEVPGRVIAVNAKRGDSIAPAQIVATLDDSQQRASIEIRTAEAQAAEQRAKLVAAGGRPEDIRALEAQLRAARANEALAVKRHTNDLALVEKGALSRSVADETEARRKTATSEREAIEQRLRELRTGARREELAGVKAQASAADAAVRLEADRARRYELRTLHAGEVLDVHVEPGEVVAAGTPVVTIGDPGHPYVDVFVPQNAIAGIQVAKRATVRVDAMKQTFAGTVEHVARRTEFTPRYIFSPEERANLVVRTRVRVDDPQHALHPGVPAFVTFEP